MTTYPIWKVLMQASVVALVLLISCLRNYKILRVVSVCICFAVAYGILQDQISARLSPEYFTVGHPRIVGLTDPTLVGVVWGFLGSWWPGMILGIIFSVLMYAGPAPDFTLPNLIRPLCALVIFVGSVTLICAVSALYNFTLTEASLSKDTIQALRMGDPKWYFVVACAHLSSYLSAVVGGIVIALWIRWKRQN